jgi:SNF2 family DNA or RNA helicase
MKLYPPQQELVDKLGNPKISARLIGDEMGIGKTIEGLGCDLRLRGSVSGYRKTLIIAPRSTHEDPWAETITKFTGKRVFVIDRKDRPSFIRALKSMDYEYYVCHYEALRLMKKELQSVQFFNIILDETHRIKNRKAQVTLTVKTLKTMYKTSMSGTPADDKPQDLWSTLNFLYPGKYASYWAFVNKYCLIEIELIKTRYGGMQQVRKIVGVNKEAVPALLQEIEPFYMRRLKKDVLKDLPDKFYSELRVDLSDPQRKVYDDLREQMLAWIGAHQDQPLSVTVVVAQLVRLQQAALATLEFSQEYATLRPGQRGMKPKIRLIEPSTKLDALVEVVQDEGISPFVVFSQSKSMINLTAERLTKEGLRVATYTGDTLDQDRALAITGFQGGRFDVFASTIASGGEGITLTKASTVFFFDRSWSPSKNIQAEDRLHRIGQKNAVQVIDIVARDSVDQRVRDTNIRKWSALRTMLGDDRAR